ncbi:MAG TPA: SIMPL domain-containing protein [Kofleriaceae bacterium]
MSIQTIERPAGINVYGSQLVRVDPDFAILDFSVIATEATPALAFSKAREAAAAVRSFVGNSSIPDADVRTSQMSLEQAFEHQGGQRRAVGFTAKVGFQVVTEALGRVELLLAGVVDAGANQVDRVTFQTSRLREIRTEARRQAFARAKAKAELFALAAGVRLGHVLHVEDINPDQYGAHRHYQADVDMTDEDPERTATNPGSIVVNAAVMVCFAILP